MSLIENNQSYNSKRIAKNTMLLYIRMLLTTLVSLFTARLTLQLLGVEDYGINNLVSGIIGFMAIVTGTMTSATQRFLAFDLGKNDVVQYQKSYSMLLNIFFIYSLFGAICLELVGPYVIQHYLVIPQDRLVAAQWVFQFTIINFILATINIPQTASIVSYEKMNIYAYFTFIDVFFKLLVVYSLYITPFDKLITIGFLTTLIALVTNGVTYLYCVKKLNGCRYQLYWNNILFKKIFSYAGWNLFGSISGVMNQQGQAILLNLFYGPVVNAAKAVADKVNGIITSFSVNFYMAVTPQIIKNYASGNIEYMRKIVLSSSRYAFFLLYCLSLPLIANMKAVLFLWLGEEQVSFEMVRFCQLLLVYSLVNVLEQPITQAVRATGKIKKYQIQIGFLTLMFIPICYIAFKCGLPAYTSMIILSLIYLVVQFVRIYIVKDIIEVTVLIYIKSVILPIILVILLSAVTTMLICKIGDSSIIEILIKGSLELMCTLVIIFIFGISKGERDMIYKYIKNKYFNMCRK